MPRVSTRAARITSRSDPGSNPDFPAPNDSSGPAPGPASTSTTQSGQPDRQPVPEGLTEPVNLDPDTSAAKAGRASESRPPDSAADGQPLEPARIRISDKPFPKPPAFNCKPDQFFKYWAGLAEDELPRAIVYVYRMWPRMDYTRGLTPEEMAEVRHKKRAITTNIDKPDKPFDPLNWRQEILHRYGSGNYHFKLNDCGTRAQGDVQRGPRISAANICATFTDDIVDINYPPVLDLAKLDLFAESNKSFIRSLQIRGVQIPGLVEEEKEGDDMAGTGVKEMAEALGRTMDQVVELARDKAQPPKPPDAETHATMRAVEGVVESMGKANSVLIDQMKQVAGVNQKAQDPNAYLDNVLRGIQALKDLAPQPQSPAPDAGGGTASVIEMMRAMMADRERNSETILKLVMANSDTITKMLEQRLATTESRLAELQRAQNPPSTTAVPGAGPGQPVTPVNPADPLKSLETALNLFDRIAGRFGGRGEAEGGPWWARPAMAAATGIANAISTGLYNAAVLKSGQGQPVAPPVIGTGEEGEYVDDGQEIQQPGPGHESAGGGGGGVNPYIALLHQIHQPMVKALNDGTPGFSFGGRFVQLTGWGLYNQLREAGKDQLIRLMQLYPPLWQDVTRAPQRFDRFLDEFLDADKVKLVWEELKVAADAAEDMASAPPPRRVNVPPKPAGASGSKPLNAKPAPATASPSSGTGPLPQAVVDAQQKQ